MELKCCCAVLFSLLLRLGEQVTQTGAGLWCLELCKEETLQLAKSVQSICSAFWLARDSLNLYVRCRKAIFIWNIELELLFWTENTRTVTAKFLKQQNRHLATYQTSSIFACSALCLRGFLGTSGGVLVQRNLDLSTWIMFRWDTTCSLTLHVLWRKN